MISRKRLGNLEYAAFVHSKLAIMWWGLTAFVHPPWAVDRVIGMSLVHVCASAAILGSTVGLVGLIMSAAHKVTRRYQGYVIEMAGIFLAMSGLLGFFLSVIFVIVKFNDTSWSFEATLSYALFGFMLSRLMIVRRSLRGKF